MSLDPGQEFDGPAPPFGLSILDLARPRNVGGHEGALSLGEEGRETFIGENREEGLVLGEIAAERIDEDGEALRIRLEERGSLRLDGQDLGDDGAPVDEVDRVTARHQLSVRDLQVAWVGEDGVQAPAQELLAKDLLVGPGAHRLQVDDRNARVGPARVGAEIRDQRVDRADDQERIGHAHPAHQRQAREDFGHAIGVSEAGRRVRIDLDEANPVVRDESIDPGQRDVRPGRFEPQQPSVGFRRAEEVEEVFEPAVESRPRDPLRQPDQLGGALGQGPPGVTIDELGTQERGHGLPAKSDAA